MVLLSPEANSFLLREGKYYLHTNHVSWQDFAQQFVGTKSLTGMDGTEHLRLRRFMWEGYSRRQLLKDLSQVVCVVDREVQE